MNQFYISNMLATISDSSSAEKVEGILHQMNSSPIYFHVDELFRINAETALKVRKLKCMKWCLFCYKYKFIL